MLPLLLLTARAADLHVAPYGTPDGDGTEQLPLDLVTALSGEVPVSPGDTVWLHAGTYGDGRSVPFASYLYGEADRPIVVRQAPGERATLDGGLEAYGAHTWFWGFEITNSRPDRRVTSTANEPGARLPGLVMAGEGTKAINLAVHDTGHPGIGFWQGSGPSGEVYGCLLWGNGIYDPNQQPPNERGDGLHSNNTPDGSHLIREVIAFRNFAQGINASADSEVGYVDHYLLEGNVAFDNGAWNLFAHTAGHPMTELVVRDNFTWRRPGEETHGSVQLGDDLVENVDVTLTGNTFVLGSDDDRAFSLKRWASAVVRDNRLVSERYFARYDAVERPGTVDWDGNEYRGGGELPFVLGGIADGGIAAEFLGWEGWRSATGFDATSSFSEQLPTTAWVSARVNAYDPDRAHVIVYGWDGAPTVAWDPGDWLAAGESFRLHDAQDWFGPPVLEGVYAGEPLLLPMDLATVAPLVGEVTHLEDRHTAPAFAVFVALRDPPTPTGPDGAVGPSSESNGTLQGGGGGGATAPCGCAGTPAPGWLAAAGLLALGVQRRRKPVSST